MPQPPRSTPAPLTHLPRPSTWFLWHDYLFRPGVTVLDLAAGEGRHGLTAAQRGAKVVAMDRDEARLDSGRELAAQLGVTVDFRCVDLTGNLPELGTFDVVLLFNYLDRVRLPALKACVAPGGVLVMETYLEWQRALGWGPTQDEHLLRPGELGQLVAPFEALHGREVFEPMDQNRLRAVASIVARRREA